MNYTDISISSKQRKESSSYPQVSMTMDAEEESALEWLQRIRSAKRKLAQNPIFFPHLSQSINNNNKKCLDAADDRQTPLNDSSRFIVNERNVIYLASRAFQCRVAKLNELLVRSQRWRRHRRAASNFHENPKLAEFENLFLHSFQRGTGIDFIDRTLMSDPTVKDNIVLEIVGRTNTMKTKILLTIAANYAAATSVLCMSQIFGKSLDDLKSIKVPIVIFDPEHAIDLEELASLVRVAILKRWNNTSELRQFFYRHSFEIGSQILVEPIAECYEQHGMEFKTIEEDIQFALGRIHIVRPKDISNGYVTALESLQESLTNEYIANQQGNPPALLLFDSMLSAFQMTSKMLESLPNGNGLSGLNDFMRQLKKLTNNHEIMIMSTRTCTGDVSTQLRSNVDGWNKIVTHRLAIAKSSSGSREQKEGYDFVAMFGQDGNKQSTLLPFGVESNDFNCKSRL